MNEFFADRWSNFEVITDTRIYSDHKPLIMKQEVRNYGNIPFKLYNSWLEDEDFDALVRKEWQEFEINGSHRKVFVLMQKLRHIKDKIKRWKSDKDSKLNVEKKTMAVESGGNRQNHRRKG